MSRFARQSEKKARERSSSLRVTQIIYIRHTYYLLYIKSKTEERLSLLFLRHKKSSLSLLIHYLRDVIFFVFFVCCCCVSIHERQNFVVVVEDEVVFAPRGVVFFFFLFFVFVFDEKKCDDVSKISPSRPSSSRTTTH